MNYESDDLIDKWLEENKEAIKRIEEMERKYPHYNHVPPSAAMTTLVVLFVMASVTIVVVGVVMLARWIC